MQRGAERAKTKGFKSGNEGKTVPKRGSHFISGASWALGLLVAVVTSGAIGSAQTDVLYLQVGTVGASRCM